MASLVTAQRSAEHRLGRDRTKELGQGLIHRKSLGQSIVRDESLTKQTVWRREAGLRSVLRKNIWNVLLRSNYRKKITVLFLFFNDQTNPD